MDNVLNAQEQRLALNDADSAAEALLRRWEDAEEPSDQVQEEASQTQEAETDAEFEEDEVETVELDADETDEDPVEEEEEPEAEEGDDVEEVELNDDLEIDILVDGETKQASLGELKRLWGQEAALTRKSQEVAEQRKEAEANIGKTNVVLQKLLEKAEARFKPYAEVDMLLASKTMDEAEFAQLRLEAQQASEDLKFLREEADLYFTDLQQQQQTALLEQAREAVKVLEQDIPDWNNALYDDIRTYAIAQGLPEDQVNSYVDPVVIKLINKARLFDQAKQVTTTKKKRVAKKVLKTSKAPNTEANDRARKRKATQAAIRNSTDLDDIANALLARWEA